jgi:hypothetical protein
MLVIVLVKRFDFNIYCNLSRYIPTYCLILIHCSDQGFLSTQKSYSNTLCRKGSVIEVFWFLINMFTGILSTSCVIFSYPKLLSISVLTFIKWRLNTELLMNTLRNVVFSTKKADHRYRKLINYALTWARPTLFIYLFLCQ